MEKIYNFIIYNMCKHDKCCKKNYCHEKQKKYKCCEKKCEKKCEYKCETQFAYTCTYFDNYKCCYPINPWFAGFPFKKKSYEYTRDF